MRSNSAVRIAKTHPATRMHYPQGSFPPDAEAMDTVGERERERERDGVKLSKKR